MTLLQRRASNHLKTLSKQYPQELQKRLERTLVFYLDCDNALSLLELARSFQLAVLERGCLRFIGTQLSGVADKEWEDSVKEALGDRCVTQIKAIALNECPSQEQQNVRKRQELARAQELIRSELGTAGAYSIIGDLHLPPHEGKALRHLIRRRW